jgi:FkbM family methyltransferase
MYELREHAWRTPGGHAVRSFIRDGTNDWNTQNAIFTGEYDIPRNRTGRAVDIGAYLGGVAMAYALDNPEATVYAIEPVPPNAELIRRNLDLNGLTERVKLVEGAVGGNHNPIQVWYGYRGNEAAEHHAFVGNSTLAYDNGGMLPHEEVTYTPITLSDLTVRGDIEWLKIDTEGAEWEFLTGPVERVETIVGEWHPVRGHTLADMASLLGSTHVVTFSGPQTGPGGFTAVRR